MRASARARARGRAIGGTNKRETFMPVGQASSRVKCTQARVNILSHTCKHARRINTRILVSIDATTRIKRACHANLTIYVSRVCQFHGLKMAGSHTNLGESVSIVAYKCVARRLERRNLGINVAKEYDDFCNDNFSLVPNV